MDISQSLPQVRDRGNPGLSGRGAPASPAFSENALGRLGIEIPVIEGVGAGSGARPRKRIIPIGHPFSLPGAGRSASFPSFALERLWNLPGARMIPVTQALPALYRSGIVRLLTTGKRGHRDAVPKW